MWRRHMWRSEGYHGEAKTWHGLARAVRRGLDNMKIQSYLTAAAVNLKRLSAALATRPLEGLGRPRRASVRPSRSQTRNGLRVRRRVTLHTARSRNRVGFNNPLKGGVILHIALRRDAPPFRQGLTRRSDIYAAPTG